MLLNPADWSGLVIQKISKSLCTVITFSSFLFFFFLLFIFILFFFHIYLFIFLSVSNPITI